MNKLLITEIMELLLKNPFVAEVTLKDLNTENPDCRTTLNRPLCIATTESFNRFCRDNKLVWLQSSLFTAERPVIMVWGDKGA